MDAGGCAPLSNRVREALAAGHAQAWADPDRLGAPSRQSRAILDGARDAIADVLGVTQQHVFFTPSPHLAFERLIAGITRSRRGSSAIVVSSIERDAVTAAAQWVMPQGTEEIPVDSLGHLDLDALESALAQPGVALVAVQHANQEIGTVQRPDAIAALAHARGVPLLVDATSSIGHLDPPSHWDALVAHPADWGGPSGLGVIAVRPSTRWLPAWPEGDDFAPGGVSVAGALAAAVALQEREEQRSSVAPMLHDLVAYVRGALAGIPGIDVLGDPDERLPHVLTFSCLYADGEALVHEFDKVGFAIGSGSACARGTLEPSRVLAAIGALTHGNVRLSLHPGVTRADVERFVEQLPHVIEAVRQRGGAPRLG